MITELSFDGDNLSPKQIPIPTGWQIILAPVKITNTTAGGIIKTSDTTKLEESVRFISKVIAIGPLAYTGDRFKPHPNAASIPFCKIGDIVSTGQYSGSQIPCLGSGTGAPYYLRQVADDEIKAVIPDVSILNI